MLFQVILMWLKDNWTYVVIVVLLCILALMGWGKCNSDDLYDKLMQDYNSQSSAFKKQINVLEATNKELREKQEILNEKHKEELARLEENYQNSLNVIKKNARTNKNIIVKEAKKNPTTLTKRVTQVFGIPVVSQ